MMYDMFMPKSTIIIKRAAKRNRKSESVYAKIIYLDKNQKPSYLSSYQSDCCRIICLDNAIEMDHSLPVSLQPKVVVLTQNPVDHTQHQAFQTMDNKLHDLLFSRKTSYLLMGIGPVIIGTYKAHEDDILFKDYRRYLMLNE